MSFNKPPLPPPSSPPPTASSSTAATTSIGTVQQILLHPHRRFIPFRRLRTHFSPYAYHRHCHLSRLFWRGLFLLLMWRLEMRRRWGGLWRRRWRWRRRRRWDWELLTRRRRVENDVGTEIHIKLIYQMYSFFSFLETVQWFTSLVQFKLFYCSLVQFEWIEKQFGSQFWVWAELCLSLTKRSRECYTIFCFFFNIV